MFNRILWGWKYRRFKKRWHGVPTPYTQFQYFQEIVSLINDIPLLEIPELYRGYTHIASAYGTIVAWLTEARGAIEETDKNRLEPQLAVSMVNCQLESYLVTEDGLLVDYLSAVQATIEQLQLLYKSVLQYSNVTQEYYYRQLKELFLSGLALCLSVLEEYDSN